MIYYLLIKLMIITGFDSYFTELTAIYLLLLTYFIANAKRLIIKAIYKRSAIKNYKQIKGF